MTFGEALEQAGQIIDFVLNQPGVGNYRLKATAENKAVIEEIIAAAQHSPFIEWFVVGMVGTETAYFTVRAKYRNFGPIVGDIVDDIRFSDQSNVIHVDFKAKTRKQAA